MHDTCTWRSTGNRPSNRGVEITHTAMEKYGNAGQPLWPVALHGLWRYTALHSPCGATRPLWPVALHGSFMAGEERGARPRHHLQTACTAACSLRGRCEHPLFAALHVICTVYRSFVRNIRLDEGHVIVALSGWSCGSGAGGSRCGCAGDAPRGVRSLVAPSCRRSWQISWARSRVDGPGGLWQAAQEVSRGGLQQPLLQRRARGLTAGLLHN